MNHKISLKRLEKIRNQSKSNTYNLKNFVRIANAQLNPDLSTLEGMQSYLVNWYCFQYGVTEKDDKLLEMTLEELLVLYQKHRLRDDPQYYEEMMNPKAQDYEEWIKEQMGENYVTEEENIKQILDYEKEYTKKIQDQYPEEVTTDFSKFNKDG